MFFRVALVLFHFGAAQFVGTVVAVGDTVAFVRLVDTLLEVRTLELVLTAGDRGTVQLVRCWGAAGPRAETVVVPVAGERGGERLLRE